MNEQTDSKASKTAERQMETGPWILSRDMGRSTDEFNVRKGKE